MQHNMVKVFDLGQPWRHMEWTLRGREMEDVREDFPEGWCLSWVLKWGELEGPGIGKLGRAAPLKAWKLRGLQTFAEGSVCLGLRSWGRDHRAQQRTIRQGLFRSRLSNNRHGQFSRASHLAPMSYFPFLNFKFFFLPLKQYMHMVENEKI